ncbi:DUF6086 family protein [Streptomyces seoulensis]
MTYSFIIDDDTVWGPANRVGRLYAGMAEAVADVLGLPTGLGEDIGEMFEIDTAQFSAFTQAMLAVRAESSHQYFWILLDSVLPISIAMLRRAGRPATPQTAQETDYLAMVNEMDLPMLGRLPDQQ